MQFEFSFEQPKPLVCGVCGRDFQVINGWIVHAVRIDNYSPLYDGKELEITCCDGCILKMKYSTPKKK